MGIIALELYLGIHPFDPTYVGNHYSIVENIMQNKYVVETDIVKFNASLVELANKTLQLQPYERFRNYQMLNGFIAKQI